MNNSEYLSRERLEEIKKELHGLTTDKRKEIAERLEYAKSMGDLSENSEYDDAKEQQSFLEEKIAKLEDIVRRAVIINKNKGDIIQIGCSVKIKKDGSGEIKEFQIVGQEEVDVNNGKISHQSPIGAALISKKKGDTATVMSPKGEIKYKIIEIL